MRFIALFLLIAVSLFAQNNSGVQHQSAPVQSAPIVRPIHPPSPPPNVPHLPPPNHPRTPPVQPVRPPSNTPVSVAAPMPYYYNSSYSNEMMWNWRAYPYPYWGNNTVIIQLPCKKEKLKDSDGKKHEILVCRQPNGVIQVVADADKLKK